MFSYLDSLIKILAIVRDIGYNKLLIRHLANLNTILR